MSNMQIHTVKATYMRGGTSKGLFFNLSDLPDFAQTPGPLRDQFLLRAIGSPDPYGKHIDGLGGGSSSTSKVVIVSKSDRPDHHVDYLFGQVSIDQAKIDWSGNCGNLTAAVGVFAIDQGLVPLEHPGKGGCDINIWQLNIAKTIKTRIPTDADGVLETGQFWLDGVAFPAAETRVEFCQPVDAEERLFPTGSAREILLVDDLGSFDVTMINAGIPTVFIRSAALNCTGAELQGDINNDATQLQKLEKIRAAAAVKMGLIDHPADAINTPHTPKVAMVAPAISYTSSAGAQVSAESIDLSVRAVSMGQLHHAMMGTAAVAIAVAALIPSTLVAEVADLKQSDSVCFGHPSGQLTVGAQISQRNDQYIVDSVSMSRSARRLMRGEIFVPLAAMSS